MISLLNGSFDFLEVFMLIFVRILGLFVSAPIFRNKNVPYLVKVGLILLMTNILIPNITIGQEITIDKPIIFAIIMAKEMFVGLVIGFSAYIVFDVLTLVGQFIDMQIGFSMVSVFDPLNQIQFTITANFYYYLFVLIAFISNLHHFFIKALVDSFELIPIGTLIYNESISNNIVEYMTRYFMLALSLAAPIVFVTMITNVVLGILARVVPSLNMFVIGFPLKIFFGLLTILIMLTAFSMLSSNLVSDTHKMIRDSLRNMGR